MDIISKRAEQMPPFIVMDVLERAHELEQRGVDIIHLEIGEPDFNSPDVVCNSAIDAVKKGLTHYTHSLGIVELRESICEYYRLRYGVDITPERVMITSGTSPALFMVFSLLLDPMDKIILPDPHYPCYPNFARFLGAEPVFVKTEESEGFQLRPDDVKKVMDKRTKAVLINSPSNPAGTLMPVESMKGIADLGIPVISDEIYHGLVYEGKEHTILEFTDNAFVLNGFSKAYAMTGWRLGYIISPEQYVRPLQKIQQNLFISAGSISQWAGVSAIKNARADVERMRDTFNERRIYMIGRLKELGFGIKVEPVGAFYILANARHYSMNSYEFAFDILERAHVGVSPGIQFGENAEGYLRFSYANSIDNIREGLDRIEAFLKA